MYKNYFMTSIQVHQLISESSQGDSPKWIVLDKSTNTLIYLKARMKEDTYDIESELIACKIAELLGLDAVQYSKAIININGVDTVVCISEDYAKGMQQDSIAKTFRHIEELKGLARFEALSKELDTIEPYWIDKQILFDYIINNTDRHLNNIEILLDKPSGQNLFHNPAVKMAPIFDNGSSLFYNNSIEEIKDSLRNNITYRKSRPFFSNHTQQIKLIRKLPTELLSKVNKVEVYKIVNSVFTQDKERANLICKWLIIRLKELNLLCEEEQVVGQSTVKGF